MSNSFFKIKNLRIKKLIKITDCLLMVSKKRDILLLGKHTILKIYFLFYYSNGIHIVRYGVVKERRPCLKKKDNINKEFVPEVGKYVFWRVNNVFQVVVFIKEGLFLMKILKIVKWKWHPFRIMTLPCLAKMSVNCSVQRKRSNRNLVFLCSFFSCV